MIFSSLPPQDLGLGTWDFRCIWNLLGTWKFHPTALVGTYQYEKLAVDISDKMWAFHDTEMYMTLVLPK